MRFIIKFAYGNKTDLIMGFKEKLPFLTEKEISEYYNQIKDVPVNTRPTDLNKKSFDFIINNLNGETILDVACGRGGLLNQIVKHKKYKATGIDYVKSPQLSPAVEFIKGNITDMPFQNSSFDTVICSHALEHLTEPEKALKELLRVAKKTVIIVIPKQREYKYTVDLHVNFYSYLYDLQKFINHPNAKYSELGNEFCCLINK